MKIVNNILFLEFGDALNAAISKGTLDAAKSRGSFGWCFMKDPSDNRKLLIQYEVLKPKYKKQITDHFGDPYKYIAASIIEPHLILKDEDKDFINGFKRDNETHLEPIIADRIKTEARVLNFLANIDAKTIRGLGFKSIKNDLYPAITQQITTKSLHLPKSYRKLRERVTKYKETGIICQFGKIDNSNRQRLTNKHTELLIAIAGDEQARQLTYTQIYAAFIAKCKELGWSEMLEPKPIHFQAVYKNIRANENKFYLALNGYKYWLNDKELIVNMEKASAPNIHWQLDGTPEALWYYDNNRKIIDKVYVFKVMDSYSWKIVGYAISNTETSQAVMNAVKNACSTTGIKPYQFLYDKGSSLTSGDTQQMLENLSKYHFAAASGRARSKTIEPWQAHMNRVVYSWYENNSGGNITATSLRSRANDDYIKKHRKEFPSKHDLIGQIHFAFSLWNNMEMGDGRTPSQKYQDKSKRDPMLLTFEDRVNNFWVFRTRGKKKMLSYPFTNQGIEVYYGKNNLVRYLPEFDDPTELAMFMNLHVGVSRFYIKYDPSDLENIALFHLTQGKEETPANMQFVTYVSTKQKTKQALADYEDGDGEQLAFYRKVQKEQKRLVSEEMNGRRERLAAENILLGAIPVGEVYKDAHNQAKIELQRIQQLGYAESCTIEEQQRMQAEPEFDEYMDENYVKKSSINNGSAINNLLENDEYEG
jgi:integrase-like protein